MCLHAIRTSVTSFCVRNLPFSINIKNILICALNLATLLSHFSSCGKMLHSVAAEESSNPRTYLTILFLFGML